MAIRPITTRLPIILCRQILAHTFYTDDGIIPRYTPICRSRKHQASKFA